MPNSQTIFNNDHLVKLHQSDVDTFASVLKNVHLLIHLLHAGCFSLKKIKVSTAITQIFEHLDDQTQSRNDGFLVIKNRTDDYHRHFFCPPTLLKMPFSSMKALLIRENILQILNSSQFFFCIFAKKTQFRWEKTLLKSNIVL